MGVNESPSTIWRVTGNCTAEGGPLQIQAGAPALPQGGEGDQVSKSGHCLIELSQPIMNS
jgi:hypothetical protein